MAHFILEDYFETGRNLAWVIKISLLCRLFILCYIFNVLANLISLHWSLSWKFCRIMKFILIIHSEYNFGMALALLLPPHGKSIHQFGWKWLLYQVSIVDGVFRNLHEGTVLWWFNINSNFQVVVNLHHQSEGFGNNFATEDASVIKERVMQGDQMLLKDDQQSAWKFYSEP